tara:strand:+ start:789 stop:1250 length:462 start_codon:yes stop_codon:yes gene_type:complete
MSTFNNPFLTSVPAFDEKKDYLKCSFWCDNHPLTAVSDKLSSQIPANGEAKSKNIEVLRLATNCYHDLYNNGGGNERRWEVRDQLVSVANEALDKDACDAVIKSFDQLTKKMTARWFPRKEERNAFKAMEVFMTNVVYTVALTDDEAKNMLPS